MSWVKLAAIAFVVIGLLIVCLTFDVWAAAFLGLLVAISLNGPAEWIRSKWRMPAWVATVLVMLMVLTVLTGLGFVIGPPLVGQADVMGKQLPAAMENSLDWLEDRKWGRYIVRQVDTLSGESTEQIKNEGTVDDKYSVPKLGLAIDAAKQQPLGTEYAANSPETGPTSDSFNDTAADGLIDSTQEQNANGNGNDNGKIDNNDNDKVVSTDHATSILIPVLSTLAKMLRVTVWTIMLFVVSFMVTLYVALNPDVYRRGICWLIPAEHEAVATLTMARMCVTLRWWMLGRLTCMVAIGLLTSLGMWLIGMPAPLALGALAGLLSFVPNIGPIAAGIPGVLLAVPEGPWMLLSVLAVYVVAQAIESNLIDPLVDQYTVTTPPAVLIFFQLIMGVLAGMWGVLIATPLLVVVLVLIQQLYVREYLKKSIKVVGTDGQSSSAGANQQHGKTITRPQSP